MLALLLLGGFVQCLLSTAMLDAMLPDNVEPRPRLEFIAAAGIVVSTTIQISIAMVGIARFDPTLITIWIPRATQFVPLISASIFWGIIFPEIDPTSSDALAQRLFPMLSVLWGTGVFLALLQRSILHAFAIRSRADPEDGLLPVAMPSSLAANFARLFSGAALATTLIVSAALIARVQAPFESSDILRLVPLILVAGAFAMVCALAGWSLGQSPGKDITSVARRLDALGHNTNHAAEDPVVVASFDELGLLFDRLEGLRTHLIQEVRVYQDALDRTQTADAAKAEFLAAVSHELRTPLNSICGFAQILLDGIPTPLTESQTEDVQLIRAGGHQLLALINDILDISMIESGELSLSFAPTDLRVIVEEVIGIHHPLLRDKDVRQRIEATGRLPTINCDRQRISQVLTNLVSNAIKFTEQGEIVIKLGFNDANNTAVVAVCDTGVGISAEELPTIFDEYRQVGSLKRRAKGTGLGLAIARTIADHHGGSLNVESRLGHGSVFTLTLPVAPRHLPSMIDMTEERARAIQRATEKRKTQPPTSSYPFSRHEPTLPVVSSLPTTPPPPHGDPE